MLTFQNNRNIIPNKGRVQLFGSQGAEQIRRGFMNDIYNEKQRIIQELVPGKQVTLAHIIASPDEILYEKLGLDISASAEKGAIGVLTVSPGETAIIMADIALKAADVELGFVDRKEGSLVFTGSVASVEAAVGAIISYVEDKLDYTTVPVTKT